MANNIVEGEWDWMDQIPGANPAMGMGFPSPAPARGPGIMDRIGGMLGGGQNFGGLLGEDEKKAAQRQALMAMASQLMAASGPSQQRVSFGQALGPALMAGQQAYGQAGQDALQAMLLKSQIKKNERAKVGTTPSSVSEYEYAKANGFNGSFEQWKRVASAQPQAPAGIQEYEYFNKLTPDQQKQFLSLQRSPVVPQVVTVNGVPTLVDRTTGDANPLSSITSEADAARRLKEAEASGASFGKASGEISAGLIKKGADAKNVQTLLEGADGLIDIATGSKVGATRDAVAGFFGYAPESAQASAELKLLEANLMLQQPRMEGPQSNMDQQLYRDMAGQIGNPEVPAPVKKAALRKILELNQKYIERAASVQGGGAAPTAPKRVRVDAQGNVVQ